MYICIHADAYVHCMYVLGNSHYFVYGQHSACTYVCMYEGTYAAGAWSGILYRGRRLTGIASEGSEVAV